MKTNTPCSNHFTQTSFSNRFKPTYSGKLLRLAEKYDFRRENLQGLLAFATPKDATAPNFAEKTFTNSHKTAKFTKVFYLESFPLYGISVVSIISVL